MDKKYIFIAVIAFIPLLFSSCKKDENKQPAIEYSYLQDVEDNEYKAVTIGEQVWMAENLKTTKYNDGTAIPNVTADEEWLNRSTPTYCWYDNDEATNKDKYGALYNGHVVATGKICPVGWHVPTDEDWEELEEFVSNDGHGVNIARALKSVDGWKKHENNYDGIDCYGFKALPSGTRNGYRSANFADAGEQGFWWSSTPGIESNNTNIRIFQYQGIQRYYGARNNSDAVAIRCVKDN